MATQSVTLGAVDVIRKRTACQACRKRKIRCHMVNGRPPCTRCKSRDIECTFNRSLETLLQDDVEWKKTVEKRLNRIENSIHTGEVSTSARTARDVAQTGREINTPATQTRVPLSPPPSSSNNELNLSCSLSSFPAVSIHGTTQDDSPRVVSGPAVLDNNLTNPEFRSNLLTNAQAEEYFSFFQKTLNPLIHHVLAEGETFDSLKDRSEFLATAVCTVAAYCTDALDHKEWLDHYKSLALARMFAKQHAFDDVRALCIGALWLTYLTTALNALAVRLSSELNLHRCLTKLPFSNIRCYERTRLYLLVYIVDHHCTLSYGRPPMTRELPSMGHIRAFLGSEFSNPNRGDSSLIGQVELWSMHGKVFDAFGADIERTIPSYVSSIEQFSRLYDNWFNDWRPILSPMSHLLRGSHNVTACFPQTTDRMPDLYYYAAKLQLFSHVFRGPAQRAPYPSIAVSNRDELSKLASHAIRCAANLLGEVTSVLDSKTQFGILPAYLAMTTAFSSVFLSRILIIESTAVVSHHDRSTSIESMERLCKVSHSLINENTTDSTDNSTPQILLAKIVNAVQSATERSCGDKPRLDARMTEQTDTNESPNLGYSPHTSHEQLDANGLDSFDDLDMFLTFDFNVLDADNFVWDESGAHATHVS